MIQFDLADYQCSTGLKSRITEKNEDFTQSKKKNYGFSRADRDQPENQDSGCIVIVINADKEEILDFNFYGIENLRNQTVGVDFRFVYVSREAVPCYYTVDVKYDVSVGLPIFTFRQG